MDFFDEEVRRPHLKLIITTCIIVSFILIFFKKWKSSKKDTYGRGYLENSTECRNAVAVRRLFVFIKENLIFEALEDDLMQRELLLKKEKEDYVCKDQSNHFRNERLLKLIIRKKRCNKFVSFMNETSCHKHISEKIMKVQEENEGSHSVERGLRLRRPSFTLTDKLLQKHFTDLYMKIEPREIANVMFQAGFITTSDHDDVTEFNQKHKRLGSLLDILKRKQLYAPFLCALQSLKYTSVLGILKKDEKLEDKPSMHANCIQRSFTLLLDDLPDSGHATVFMEHELDQSNISDIESCCGIRRQKSKLLKILLMKGTPACEEFFRAVEVDLKRGDLIQKMINRSKFIKERGKPRLYPKLEKLKISCLEDQKDVFRDELEPLELCDFLFEERAIEILTHDKITEINHRQTQIKYLLETVNENKNDCYHFFVYILQRKEYKFIIEKLERPSFKSIETESSEHLEWNFLHNIKKISDDARNENVSVRLAVKDTNGTQIEQALIQQFHSSQIQEESISHGQMLIENVKTGSVIFQLRPVTDQAVQTLLNARDNNKLLEMIFGMLKKVNISKLMNSSKSLDIELQVYYSKSGKHMQDSEISKAALIKNRVKAHRNEIVSELESGEIASILSKSKNFPKSWMDEDHDICSNKAIESLLSFVENGSSEVVEEFLAVLKDLGYCNVVDLIDAPDIHRKAENIRKMMTTNYKQILEEMQMALVNETLSKCIGNVDAIREKCLPKNGTRKQRMNAFLHFILQDDHNVVEFEKMLRNNGLENLLKLDQHVSEEHASTHDIEVRFADDCIQTSSEEILFESVITLSYTVVANPGRECYGDGERVRGRDEREKPTIEIYSDKRNNRYCIGEDVTIIAKINNPSAILSMTWQKEDETGSHTIDTTLSKYKETIDKTGDQLLLIRDCRESDMGTYFIFAACMGDAEYLISNKIFLGILKGLPIVSITRLSEAQYDDCVQIKATIRSFPKHISVIWRKGNNVIDTTKAKYEGSLVGHNLSILCINKASKWDEDIYTVEITNDFGNTMCTSDRLKIIGEKPIVKLSVQPQSITYGNTITLDATITSRPAPRLIQWKKEDIAANIIFISGPVVVLSSAKIQLQAIYPPSIQSATGEWFRIKNNISTKLEVGTPGYSMKTYGSQTTVQTIEIASATEDDSLFQLSVGTTKSNIINVFVDDSGKYPTEYEGNCLRFFALQDVSKDALRKVFDNVPGTFELKWSMFEKFCKVEKRKFHDLMPTATPRSSSDLDFTMLYAMFRNTTSISSPTKGWGNIPGENDIKTADDIERVRIYRSKISHENSSEMTTKDFNESVLDLIWAIRRLTADDEQLMKRTCEILNNICCKSKELEILMENLRRFRESARKQDDLLKEYEGECTMEEVIAIDKQAIRLAGRPELYLGETAIFTAFIEPNISTLSRIFWQKKNSEGYFYTIDIDDGKYTGSTLALPSPQLYIHFIRAIDEGIYRIVVDAYNSRKYNSIQLKVKKRECDEGEHSEDSVETGHFIESLPKKTSLHVKKEETSGGYNEMIGFHEVRDSNIVLLHNATIARKKNGEDINGVCFSNRPIRTGERIYIRIAETYAKWSSSMRFGLTNMDPFNIHLSPGEIISKIRKCCEDTPINYLPDLNDVLCLTLNTDAKFSFSINDVEQHSQKLKHVSVHDPIWLSFDLWGKARAIEISSRKPKEKTFSSYFREYSF